MSGLHGYDMIWHSQAGIVLLNIMAIIPALVMRTRKVFSRQKSLDMPTSLKKGLS